MSSCALFVDLIITLPCGRIALVDRGFPPFGWALPGGLVDDGETPVQAAQREALEETGLAVTPTEILATYPFVNRVDQCTGLTIVYLAEARGELVAASDVKAAQLYEIGQYPDALLREHRRILTHFEEFRRCGIRPSPHFELVDHRPVMVADSRKVA